MAVRGETVLGAPCWVDLGTADVNRAADFYGEIFGWTGTDQGEEFGHYQIFSLGDKAIGGMMQNQPGTPGPDSWTTYLASADIAASTRAVADAGGLVFSDPMDVMALGTMAIVADSGGATVGIWQPNEFDGTELVAQAGAPCWFELHTRQYEPALEFYRTVFGWETNAMSDTDEFKYSQMLHNGEPYAGVMDVAPFLPECLPSSWQIYFGAEDVEGTVARIVELGGQILQPVEDSPFGKVAQVEDPMGATFKLSSAPVS